MKSTILTALLFTAMMAGAQTRDSIVLLMQQYDYHGALQKIELLQTDSLDTGTLYLKATALKTLSRFPEALVCYDSLYRADSTNIKIMLELADCYKSVSNMRKSREIYEQALQMQPGNKYIRQLLAGVHMTTEQYGRALPHYLMACSDDTSAYLLKQIATCFEKTGMEDSAVFYYLRAAHWNPNDYQPFFRLANLYKSRREYEKGIAVTDSFLARVPDNRDVTRLSGYLHYLNQSLPIAIERFQQSLALSDTSVFVYKYLGYSYFKLNNFDPAINCLEKVYAVDSSDIELCYALGLAHDRPRNIRYFNAAVNLIVPAMDMLSDVYQDLALALTKDRQYNKALEALMKAWQVSPFDYTLLYKIGVHYDNWMDDKKMALQYYRDFLATRTDDNGSGNQNPQMYYTDPSDYYHAERRIKDIESIYMTPPPVVSDTMVTSQ